MDKIATNINLVKDFIKGKINNEMSSEELDSFNKVLGACDEILTADTSRDNEVSSLKDVIIRSVQNSGDSKPPKDELDTKEKKPRTLEEIANDVKSGGK